MGWGYFLYLFIGTAAIIDIFIVYLGFYIPGLSNGETLTPLGIAMAVIFLWIFTWINLEGVKWGGIYSIVTTIGKLIPLAIFCFVGFGYIQGHNFFPMMPYGFTGVTLAITLFFWSYTGFEAIVVPSEEVKNPARTIPWAMVITILITIVVYTLIAFVFVGIINWQALGLSPGDWVSIGKLASPLSDLSKAIGLPWLAALVAIGAIVATGGSGGSWVLIQGRMPYAMAKDKLFWSPLAKVNKKHGTPNAALIFTSALTTIILITIPNFPSVALIASVTAVVPYAAAVLSVPILRKSKPNVKRPFRLPFNKLFTLIGFILCTFLVYWASWPWSIIGSLLMLTGYPAFLFVKNKKWEFRRNLWVIIYLIGIMIISFLGDSEFTFNNFTPWQPLNYLRMPYDLIALSILAIIIYILAYKENIKTKG